MSHIMLIGIQGSGKGTQARKILEKSEDYVLFDMGGELRKFAQSGTPDGDHVKSFLDNGLKAPIEYIIKFTEKFLAENKGKKVLIDGAIRSREQNDAMEKVWGNFDVIYLEFGVEDGVKRLCGRRIDAITQETFPSSFKGETNPKTGNTLTVRADDTEEAIRSRIAWSIADTLPLIDIWEQSGHKIYKIDASQSEEEIFDEIEQIIMK